MEPDRTMSIVSVLSTLMPILLWICFWFFCVNWRKTWPVLAEGGWAPVVLLMFISAEVWSRVAPGPCSYLPFVSNFWWQLGSICILVAIALICGWVQALTSDAPPELALEPPPAAHGHGQHNGHH